MLPPRAVTAVRAVLLSALQGGTMLSHLHGDGEPLARALDGAIAQLT
jgi:hypothetical protein